MCPSPRGGKGRGEARGGGREGEEGGKGRREGRGLDGWCRGAPGQVAGACGYGYMVQRACGGMVPRYGTERCTDAGVLVTKDASGSQAGSHAGPPNMMILCLVCD